jgi:hypothetical protein
MPLHMTKIAYGSESVESLRRWIEGQADSEGGAALMTTRYLPKRHEEMIGGSLYWIFEHVLIGRSPILGFEQKPDGRWWIRLEPRLIPIEPRRKRAHQGWRYLADEDAPRDIDGDVEAGGDVLPGRLIGELAKLGLV